MNLPPVTWILIALLVLGVVVIARSSSNASASASSDSMRVLVREQGALLLDVRSAAEFNAGHMQGALNLPVDQVSSIGAIESDHERNIVVYCRSGARSARATQILRQAGYTNVHDLGPMARW